MAKLKKKTYTMADVEAGIVTEDGKLLDQPSTETVEETPAEETTTPEPETTTEPEEEIKEEEPVEEPKEDEDPEAQAPEPAVV